MRNVVILSLLCFRASSHLLAAETPTRREVVLQVDVTKSLKATITRRQNDKTGLEVVTCQFWRGTATGKKVLVGTKTSMPGVINEDVVATGNFLANGRQQILVFSCMGGTEGELYDFDGHRVRTVYSSEGYSSRVWLKCPLNKKGRSLIEEDWGKYDEEQPAGSQYRRSNNTFVRLLRWQRGQWVPIKFRFVKEQPVPIIMR